MSLSAKSLMDGLRGLGVRLRGVLPGAGRRSDDAVLALVLDSNRLYGVGMVRGRAGWTRGAAGEWGVAPAESAPGAAPDITQAAAPLAAAFSTARSALNASSVVLGLPTSVLLLRVLRLPALTREELSDAILLQMDKLSPFPGDELSIGWEVLSEDAEQVTVFAAAAPDRHMQAVDQACSAAGLQVMRVDVALLAWWRMLREQQVLVAGEGRQAVLISEGGEWDLLVLDRGQPVVVRGLGRLVEDQDLARELTLTLFQTEMESGSLPLEEVVVVAPEPPAESVLEPIRHAITTAVRCVTTPAHATAADGLCLRTVDGATLDLTPASWRHREQGAASRRRLILGLSAATGLWLALLATLVLGPFVTDQLIQMQKRREVAIHADYQKVFDARERVRLINRYKDRSASLLESLRTICATQPEGVDLSEMTYERGKSCKFKGEAANSQLVLDFVDQIRTNAPFTACKLNGPSAIPGSPRQRFEMDAILEEAPR